MTISVRPPPTHGFRARSSANQDALREFGQTLPYVGLRVLMPAVLLVLVTGIGLVLSSAEWHFSQFWVVLALALFAVAFLIGALYMSRVGIALERIAGGEGGAPAQALALINRWLVGYAVVLVVLLVALWDMVFKSGT
jgi:Predicted integral membrane protein (DUF2269)